MIQVPKQSIDLVVDMFEDWFRVYGSKLKERQTLDLRTAKLWAVALKGFELTLGEFKTAYAKSTMLEWPPTAPADFVKLARGDRFKGYPEIRQAYLSAANENYTHDVIYETANRIGFWELRTQPESVTWMHWQKIYLQVCQEHLSGVSFKLPQSRQIEHKHILAAPDSPVFERFEEIKKQFGVKRGQTL